MNAEIADLPFDQTDDDIDWDDIIATTQDDVDAGRYAFSTEDYPTHEEGMAALWKWMCSLGHGGSNETIVYAYLPAVEDRPWGIVTVRAIQHRRVRDVFFGVRERGTVDDEPRPYLTV